MSEPNFNLLQGMRFGWHPQGLTLNVKNPHRSRCNIIVITFYGVFRREVLTRRWLRFVKLTYYGLYYKLRERNK